MTTVTYDFNGLRGTGRTCRLIENAPPNAYFIVSNLTIAAYVEDYAREIGREDLQIYSPMFFDYYGGSRGLSKSPIVLDHNVVLTVDQYRSYLSLLDKSYSLTVSDDLSDKGGGVNSIRTLFDNWVKLVNEDHEDQEAYNVTTNISYDYLNQNVKENQMKQTLSYQEIGFIASQIAKADPGTVIYATVGNTSHYYAIADMLGRKDLYFDRRAVDPTCIHVDEELESDVVIRVGTVVRLKSDGPDMTVSKIYEEQRSVDVVWFDETQQLRFCSLAIDALEIVEF